MFVLPIRVQKTKVAICQKRSCEYLTSLFPLALTLSSPTTNLDKKEFLYFTASGEWQPAGELKSQASAHPGLRH